MGSDGCRCGKPSNGADLEPVMEATDQFVKDYIPNLSTIPIDLSKPLYRKVHVLNVRTRDAEATGVFRIHHSLGDGMSLMHCSSLAVGSPTTATSSSSNGVLWLLLSLWMVLRLIWLPWWIYGRLQQHYFS
ncbi:hypothetical protein SLA2020_468960 [Shorea laevis]